MQITVSYCNNDQYVFGYVAYYVSFFYFIINLYNTLREIELIFVFFYNTIKMNKYYLA